ncbi:helix-turn-helix transcriptional regulator [Pontivivens insulae]|uniref:histidine kinase n=1 Tax=Pontivivens insulae TaxID=1639689 RepID=A0A2R8ACV9_9RHOB|nr:helix-turn-helix transcriptional regulator [Pontivivens insulae]RED14010.1 hypothetical protein DFR53_1361 [Pontivivens insulae]SPF30084.1 HTH-type transcriptional regulator PrpR [Pontivivens insulae]
MSRSFAGLRIRERRKQLRLSQTALAKAAGISPSYLNLIEHNRRPVAGRVMLMLAKALDMPAAGLGEEAELGVVQALRDAAADLPVHAPETHVTEEFVGRYPGWARLLATLDQTARSQRVTIEALSDRLTHDPTLQSNMHEMLTTITAIRSTSSILASIPDIDPPQQARFVEAIHGESERLSEVASALTDYFDNAVELEERSTTPEEEVAQVLEDCRYDLVKLERGEARIEDAIPHFDALSTAAKGAFRAWAERWIFDARAIPRATLIEAFERPVDLVSLAVSLRVPLDQLMRRIAFLDEAEVPRVGLLTVNAAGHYLLRRPIPDWPLSRQIAACPLWPLFDATSQPERLIAARLVQPSGQASLTLSASLRPRAASVGERPQSTSTMLILPPGVEDRFITGAVEEIDAGPGCRICARPACLARSAAPIIELSA